MVSITFGSSFKRVFRKKIKNDPKQEKRFWEKVQLFVENLFGHRLDTHKLNGDLTELRSFSVEYDLRVSFYFENGNRAVFVNIGTYDEVY